MAGGAVYLLSGYDEESGQTTEWISTEGPSTWSQGPRLPYPVGPGSCSVSPSPTTIIITGGYYGLNKVSRLDVTTGTWAGLPDLPKGRYYHGCAVVNQFLVVAAGLDESYIDLSSTYILDLDTMKWSRGGEMNQARIGPQMVVLEGGRILVLGGFNGDGVLSTIEAVSYTHLTLPTKA